MFMALLNENNVLLKLLFNYSSKKKYILENNGKKVSSL